jgi:hypothetical protein
VAGRTRWQVLGGVAALAMVGFWFYLFVLADPDTPDELDDPAFAEAAGPICAEMQEAIDDLPPAREADSPEERAETVDQANQLIAETIDELEAVAPQEGQDARIVRGWLEDWRTYLEDRQEYAGRLAAGEDAELLVTARGTGQITVTMDRFADINDLPDCRVPLDA